MSLTKTRIDPLSRRLLTIYAGTDVYVTASRDDDGNPVPTQPVVHATVYGDVQPWAGGTRFGREAVVETTGSTKGPTNVAFLEERVEGVTEKMYLGDSKDAKVYRIHFVHDYAGAPQELDLRLATDQEA